MIQRFTKQARRWKSWWIFSIGAVIIVLGSGYLALNWATHTVLKSMVNLPAADVDIGASSDQSVGGDSPIISLDQNGETNRVLFIDRSDVRREHISFLDQSGEASESAPSPEQASEKSESARPSERSSGKSENVPSSVQQSVKMNGNSSSDQAGVNSSSASEKTSRETPSQDETPEVAADSGSKDLTYSAEVSVDKAKAVEEKITLQEQTKVATTLAKRLTAGDINEIIQLMQGGMSVTEKRKAKDIILDRLSAEEYNDLILIAAKYGLSQGKSYEESLKE